MGIPNVGKSSIVNEILGEHRFITSPVAHTTREANDTLVEFDKREYLLIDTAGIRRQARVQAGIEHAGVRQSLERLRQADIVVLVLDAGKAIDTQEQNLGRLIREAGVGASLRSTNGILCARKIPQPCTRSSAIFAVTFPICATLPS